MKFNNLIFIKVSDYFKSQGVFHCDCDAYVITELEKVKQGRWVHCDSGLDDFEKIMFRQNWD